MKEYIRVVFVFLFSFLKRDCGKGIKRWFEVFFFYYLSLDCGNVLKWLCKKGGEVSFVIYWNSFVVYSVFF